MKELKSVIEVCMKTIRHTSLGLVMALSLLALAGCAVEPGNNSQSNSNTLPSPAPSASPSATAVSQAVPVTLPVLDALFSDEAFRSALKSKVQLTDDQLAQLQKLAADEVARLRETNVEEKTPEERSLQESRVDSTAAISKVIGEQKTQDLFALARDYWVKGNEALDTAKTETKSPADTLLPGPNAIPKDTRIVVNIPAFRMDVFKEGALVKSYKIGIGYPEFPLPTGLRKAQTIIFNPTWTPPDEPWVAKMKNVSVGEKVAAGSKLNPLGPIKIPIGLPSLIHGGKSPAKLGTFASHGCVGLTTAQVQDFSKLLAQVAGSEITEATIKSYFADKTKTRVVKLDQVVPVELRYETIVVEDGKLHIFRDVYDQDTNTEANLRAVLEANGVKLEDLSEAERGQIQEALNAMSRHPAKPTSPANPASKPAADSPTSTASPASAATTEAGKTTAATPGRKPQAKLLTKIAKNQKEVVVELAALSGKGYPAAMNLDTGSGKPATVAIAKATPSKAP
jgi:lipoprotein-anchoring transpeptidase ErfK/SrfK